LRQPTAPRRLGQLFALAGLPGNRTPARRLYPGAYLTIDRWVSEEAFRAFRKDHDPNTNSLTADATPSPLGNAHWRFQRLVSTCMDLAENLRL